MQISCNLVIQEKQRRLRASLLCGYAQKGYYTHSNKCKRNLRTKWQVDLFTLFFSILKFHQISINEWNLCKGFDEWQINPQRVLVYLLFHSTHAIVELGNVCSWNLRKRKALNYSISIWGKRNSERERKRERATETECVWKMMIGNWEKPKISFLIFGRFLSAFLSWLSRPVRMGKKN